MERGEGKVVCVTGGSGYVPSCLVKLLLQRGYTVNATVRCLSDPKKVVHLKALEGAEERLRLFEANLTEDGSFDSAIDGCECVFHTASPVFQTDNPQAEVIEPAVTGTVNVLTSCSKVASVRRAVLTSSTAAVLYSRNPTSHDVVIDETWFSDPVFCEETKQWYFASKTLVEQAEWRFAEEHGIDLVVMNPGLLLQPTLNQSSMLLLEIIKGKFEFPSYQFVNVRDVARAHIAAFENCSANGRYLLVGKSISHPGALQLLYKLYPSINCPINATATKIQAPRISKSRAESLGVSFMPLEVSLKDTIESLKENNFLTL